MDRKRRRKAGFTLIELMTVVIIVGILAAVAIPLYRGQVKRAMASEGDALLGSVLTGERVYYAEHNIYTDVTNAAAGKDLLGVEVVGHKYFTEYAVDAAEDGTGFTATTTGEVGGDAEGITVTMEYNNTDGATITHE